MRFSTGNTGNSGFLANPVGCLLMAAVTLVCFASTGAANDGVTSNEMIQRAGLTLEWFTHSGVDPSGGIVDWEIKVDENKPTTFFTIKAGTYTEEFSQNTLSAFGKPYGVEGAREYAEMRKDVLKAEFENDGIKDIDIQISEYTLPETTIYVLTSNAMVQAIDGDTGAVKWSSRVGDPGMPSIGVGAGKKLVAAINGSTLYCLNAENGKLNWSSRCGFAPSASPTVSEDKIFVPQLNGRLEEFDHAESGATRFAYASKGRVTARPLTTEKTVAWPTSNGDFNVAGKYTRRRGVAYQLRADGPIINHAAFYKGMFYVTSLDGFIYALDEERGIVVWQVSTGAAISQAPIVLGNYVYVINNANQMYKIDMKTGWEADGWEAPRMNVSRFLGAGKEHMYLLDPFGRLIVMGRESGAVLSTINIGNVTKILPNLESDRMYIVSDRGMIHCLREIGSPIPLFHSNEYVAAEVDATTPGLNDGGAGQTKPAAADLDDPFGGVTKPADKVVDPGSDAGDPFGGVKPDPNAEPDNPFGGVKPDPGADNPFGGGQPDPANSGAGAGNPFGGGNKGGGNKGGAGTTPDDDDPFK